jgi:hypothetical protein
LRGQDAKIQTEVASDRRDHNLIRVAHESPGARKRKKSEKSEKSEEGTDKGEAPSTDVTNAPFASVRSDIFFQDGEITCEAYIENPKNKVQFRLVIDGSRSVWVGLNLRDSAYGFVWSDNDGQKDVGTRLVSSQTPPPSGVWLPLVIRSRGSNLELFVSGVRVASVQLALSRAPIELIMRGIGETQVRNIQVSAVRPQAFVVMQFTDEYNELFRQVISPVCQEFGYEVIRADNIYTNSLIIQDITKSIENASLIIADLTPNNANVYYEVGYAHGIQKPTILLSDRKREKLPFDISGFRVLFYDNTIGGKSEVENALRKHLQALDAA